MQIWVICWDGLNTGTGREDKNAGRAQECREGTWVIPVLPSRSHLSSSSITLEKSSFRRPQKSTLPRGVITFRVPAMKPRRIKHTRSYSESAINYFDGDFKSMPNGPGGNPQQRGFMNNQKFHQGQPFNSMNAPPQKMRIQPPIPPGTYSVRQIQKFLNDTIVDQQKLHQEFIQRNAELEKKQKYLVNLLLKYSQNHATQKIKQLQQYNTLLQQQENQREMFIQNMTKVLNTQGNTGGSPPPNQNHPKLNVNMPLHQQILNQQFYQNLSQHNQKRIPPPGHPRGGGGGKPPYPMNQNRPGGFGQPPNRPRMIPPPQPPKQRNGMGRNNQNQNMSNQNRMKMNQNFGGLNMRLSMGSINNNPDDDSGTIITPPTGSDPRQDDYFDGGGMGGLDDDGMGGLIESPDEMKKPSRPFSPDPMDGFGDEDDDDDDDDDLGSFDENSFNNFTNSVDEDDLPLADMDLPDLSKGSSSGSTGGRTSSGGSGVAPPPASNNRGPPRPPPNAFGNQPVFDDGFSSGMDWNSNLTPMSPPTPDRKVKRIKHEHGHRRTQSFNELYLSQHY